MNLLEFCRKQGVAMGSICQGLHVGWTTNQEAAAKCGEAGARVTPVKQTDCMGFEVACLRGSEVGVPE